jgi:hypothetical protein
MVVIITGTDAWHKPSRTPVLTGLPMTIRYIFRCFFAAFLGCGLLFGSTDTTRALSVTDYGAVGDAVQFYVNTVSNSAVVTTTNQLSSADIGKSIEVFGVGP